MSVTIASLFLDDGMISPDVARRIHHSGMIEILSGELRRYGDPSLAHHAQHALHQALRHALSVPLLDVLLPVWRTHPRLADPVRADATALVGLGEHEVVSSHRPRIDVLGPSRAVTAFELDARLELMIQSATLQVEPGGRISRVWVGASEGKGTLSFGERILATFERDDLGLGEEMVVTASLPSGASAPDAENGTTFGRPRTRSWRNWFPQREAARPDAT